MIYKCYCCNIHGSSFVYYKIERKKKLETIYLCMECNDILYKDFSGYQKQWWKDHKFKAVEAVGKIPMAQEEK